jgi:hypothetical protein
VGKVCVSDTQAINEYFISMRQTVDNMFCFVWFNVRQLNNGYTGDLITGFILKSLLLVSEFQHSCQQFFT